MHEETITSSKGKCVASTSPSTKTKSDRPSLIAAAPYIKRNGWEHRPIPEELTRLPEDVTIPEKLQQIIIWSMISGSNWSFQRPKCSTTTKNTHSDTPAKETNKPGESSCLTVAASTSTFGKDNVSTSSFKTAQAEPSSSASTHSGDAEKSLKNKLLSKIGFSKSENRPLPVEDVTKEAVPAKNKSPTAECTSCFEELPEKEMARLKSCRHWYCGECLNMLILTAMSAEVSFPPKCCLSPIPLKQVLKALDAKQREEYQAKAAEYAIPATDRWYCPSKDCLKWIPPNQLKADGALNYNCPHCSTKLCRTCRGPAHAANAECPQDFGLEAILETAEIEGWQRCYKCRTMVEHSTGCRHMTCRCRAEFCYVCGLRWQTCACTESDAATKRAGAQRRRTEAAAKHNEEAAEIARAIAEVEEMERREEEQRRIDEERRQREEEEQLQLLEVMRLEEEAQKQRELQQAERDLLTALVTSFEDEWKQMEDIHHQIMTFQYSAIHSRHQTEDSRLDTLTDKDEEEAKQEFKAFSLILERNSKIRRNRLSLKQKLDTEALAIRQEEAEDDLFLKVQMRLRGKANKESRMERMLGEIRKQQEEERQELEAQQKSESKDLEEKIALDNEGLRRWCGTRIQQAKDHQLTALRKFGYQVGADRQYCEVIFERRTRMLAQHRQKSISSIEAGEEPIGLTEYEASQIQPFLPELDEGEQGPSGLKRGPEIIMTPHGPLTIDQPSGERANNRSSSQLQVPHSIDNRNSLVPQQLARPPRPPIPGSFPGDEHPLNHHTTPPPRHPQHQPPPTPPQIRHQLPPLSIPNTPVPQRKPVPASQTINLPNPTIPALTMASLACTALQTLTQHQGPIQQQPTITILKQPSVTTRALAVNPISSPSSLSSLTTPGLTAKKSRWGFMRSKEVTEDEMKRRLRMAVGDAF